MRSLNLSGPLARSFIEKALGDPREWGDGAIMEAIGRLIEMLAPLFMQCFAMNAKKRFIRTAMRMSPFRERKIQYLADNNVSKVYANSDEWAGIADATANGIVGTLSSMSSTDLGNLFDEMHTS